MLEKEVASIIKFILDSAGNPVPYYHNMPKNFVVPSVYFPSPEITFEPDTFSTYGADYNIFVNFFHSSTELAYELALPVFHSINAARKLIPVIDINGKTTGQYIRIQDVQLKKSDECAYQMQVGWVSRRPYNCEEAQLIQNFYLNGGKI